MKSSQIKKLRKALKLTIAEFSKKAGVTYQSVVNWETGVYSPRRQNKVILMKLFKKA